MSLNALRWAWYNVSRWVRLTVGATRSTHRVGERRASGVTWISPQRAHYHIYEMGLFFEPWDSVKPTDINGDAPDGPDAPDDGKRARDDSDGDDDDHGT